MTEVAAELLDEGALPRRFGRYVLFDKIGEGGMARIFLAREKVGLGGHRLIVVKEILPLLAVSKEMSQLLIDEAKLCAGLAHKNIVQVTDLGRDDGRLYIAMEYVEGLDLRDLLRGCSQKKVPLPVEFSLFVVCETLRALDYAHRRRGDDGRPLGIVHRDVSPSNVLLSVEGEVKLCDFGIARALSSGDALPEEAIQGKAGYMSPEAARGDLVDARSDVFAAGIVLWELLSGQRLYRSGGGRPAPLEQARQAVVPPLPARGYPDEQRLHAIVRRAVARDPVERFQSAEAMLEALETYVADARLGASAIRFGEWLVEHFGSEIVELRRERERAAKELDEQSGRRESGSAPPASDIPSVRPEQTTVPDPAFTAELPREAYRESAPPAPPAPAVSSPDLVKDETETESARPSKTVVFLLIVLFVAVGAIAALFFGHR